MSEIKTEGATTYIIDPHIHYTLVQRVYRNDAHM